MNLEMIAQTIATWTIGAVLAVGLIQWMKSLLDSIKLKSKKKFFLTLSLPGVSYCIYLASGAGDLMKWLGYWTIAQVCYELIVQKLTGKTGK